MKYHLFAGSNYYPSGFEDYVGSFHTYGGAVAHAATLNQDWIEVLFVNSETGRLEQAWEQA